ncbi:MAG: hypothetical protein HKN32_00575, partial [Flavobacteriales bacterium]|nr:hypothetical protein [Flavobacteriales bacterium]
MKIKTVVIDADARSRKMFKQLVEEFVSDIEVLGEAESVMESTELLAAIKPDLVVVDKQAEEDGRQILQTHRSEYVCDVALLAHYHDLPTFEPSSGIEDVISKPVNVESVRHLA